MPHSAALEETQAAGQQAVPQAQRRRGLNINKLQAALCILLSATVSVVGIVFLVRAFS